MLSRAALDPNCLREVRTRHLGEHPNDLARPAGPRRDRHIRSWVAQQQALLVTLEKLQEAWAAADTAAVKKQLKTAIDLAWAKLRDIAKNRSAQIGIG